VQGDYSRMVDGGVTGALDQKPTSRGSTSSLAPGHVVGRSKGITSAKLWETDMSFSFK
jgi:hypothetical protein